jgi:SSS family solute:Na+ symporter
MLATRIGVFVGILVAVYLSYVMELKFGKTGTAIVARGTAIFFGLCACAFLPMYVGALWSRAITKAGAIAGMLSGSFASLFWILFVQEKASTALLLCNKLFGTRSLAISMVDGKEVFTKAGPFVWAFVDPLIIGLPLAILVTVIVSWLTKRFAEDHLNKCMGN